MHYVCQEEQQTSPLFLVSVFPALHFPTSSLASAIHSSILFSLLRCIIISHHEDSIVHYQLYITTHSVS